MTGSPRARGRLPSAVQAVLLLAADGLDNPALDMRAHQLHTSFGDQGSAETRLQGISNIDRILSRIYA